MAQVVIFAPAGEDVSAGQTALEGAGHTVEVVEATAANLLHMAIGMVDGGESPASDEPITEPVEEPTEDPLAAEAPPEEPKTESIGMVNVDGENIPAYLDRSLEFPLLRAAALTSGVKRNFKINESVYTYWRDTPHRVSINCADRSTYTKVGVAAAKTKPYVILDEATARHLRLV